MTDETPKQVIKVPRSPEAVRGVVEDKCVQVTKMLIADLDDLLMGGDDQSHECGFNLPGGVVVKFTAKIEMVEDGAAE